MHSPSLRLTSASRLPGKIELKDAYLVIPIWKDHRKYLRFIWMGSLLELVCLPFGLSVAPKLFTRLLKPVVSLLRRTGIRLIIYALENLGFVINHEKSCFVPTQKLEFLGFVVDTLAMTLLLPDCKVKSIKSQCNDLLALQEVSIPSLFKPGSGSVGMGTQSAFLSQCRAPIRASEYRGGLAISALPGLEQFEVMPRSVSRSDVNPRAMYQGPVRGPAKCTAASVFQFETRSPRAGLGCASTGLVKREELCFSSFLPDNAIASKVEGTGRRVGVSNPVWPTQVWYPILLDLSVSLPVLLPTSQNILLGPQGQVHPLITNQTLFLAAWHVSNNPCNRKAFLQTLPSSSWQFGSLVLTQFITPSGRKGIAGVSHGIVIHFASLWQI